MKSNRKAAAAFRNEVLVYLHAQGLTTAVKPPERHGLSPEERRPHGDIQGLPWTVAVRNYVNIGLSEAADEVQAEARAEGKPWFVSVQSRRNHPVEEAYATMPLRVWVQVLKATEGIPG